MLPIPPGPELIRRLPRCLIGLAVFGVGIALVVRADLGLAPWDVFHQGVSERTGSSLGLVIILTGVALLALWIPLRQRVGIGTVLNALEIGVVVDLALAVVPETDAAALRWIYLAGGIGIIAIGSGLYIGSGLGSGPRDGLMVGLNERFGWSIRVSRTVVEIAALASGWALGGSVGIGTIVFALGIGPLAHLTLIWFRVAPTATVVFTSDQPGVDLP
ncbi:MAG: YitT family protein [Acidimicrobiia bacterium]